MARCTTRLARCFPLGPNAYLRPALRCGAPPPAIAFTGLLASRPIARPLSYCNTPRMALVSPVRGIAPAMLKTPYYLIDKRPCSRTWRSYAAHPRAIRAKVLLAPRGFATWSVFDLMREYMDGTTSSSLFEVRLGREKLAARPMPTAWPTPRTTSTTWSPAPTRSSSTRCRSSSATRRAPRPYRGAAPEPRHQRSGYDLATPPGPSTPGRNGPGQDRAAMPMIDGFMVHNNCENRDFTRFDALLTELEHRYGHLLGKSTDQPGRRDPLHRAWIRAGRFLRPLAPLRSSTASRYT